MSLSQIISMSLSQIDEKHIHNYLFSAHYETSGNQLLQVIKLLVDLNREYIWMHQTMTINLNLKAYKMLNSVKTWEYTDG